MDPTPWQAPDPHQLVRLRAEMVDRLLTPAVYLHTVTALASGNGTLHPSSDPDEAAAKLLADERDRLRTARLYSVTDEMTQIAIAAGATMPTWKVLPEDIPAASGLLVFDSPIAVYDSTNYAVPVQIVAASWGPTAWMDDVVWLTFWSMNDAATTTTVASDMAELRDGHGLSWSEARKLHRMLEDVGPLIWDNEAMLSFRSSQVAVNSGPGGRELVDPADPGHRAGKSTLGWVQTVRAAWMLIQRAGARRPIAQVQDAHLPRTIRRSMEREGYAPNPVTVVSLAQHHRRQGSDAEHASGYKVKVRSVVRPHIRWQPYTTRGTIEPILIEQHVRGPKDAPFTQPRTKVYRVDG